MQSEKRVYEELKRWYIRKWEKINNDYKNAFKSMIYGKQFCRDTAQLSKILWHQWLHLKNITQTTIQLKSNVKYISIFLTDTINVDIKSLTYAWANVFIFSCP